MDNKTKTLSLGFNAKVKPLEKINDEFTKVKIYVQGIGKNRNQTYMSKESVERNLGSLPYCPIVGHLYQTEDEKWIMGGHDFEIVVADSGISIKDLTVPYGVVCDKDFEYETVNEYGTDVEYLVCEAILWTGRYSALSEAVYSDDFLFNQSMEIDVKQYRDYDLDSNYVELLEWTYSALCLLGKADDVNSEAHTEPCFISSHVEPIQFAFNDDFSNAFSEMKEKLAFCFENIKIQEGGTPKLSNEIIVSILAEYKLTLEDIDFEISEDMTENVLREKADEFAKKPKQRKKCAIEKFAATYNQKRQAIQNACDATYVYDDEGDVESSTYYWICDFDDTYVYVEQNTWNSNGDSETHVGRFAYAFDEATLSATLTSEFELMVVKWLTVDENEKLELSRNAFTTLQVEFEEYKKNYSTPNDEVNELSEFKAKALSDQREADEAALFEEFDKELSGDAAYETLKTDCAEMSLDEISDKCFSILGRKNAKFSFSKTKPKTVKVPAATVEEPEDNAPYGGVQKKYLKR